MQSLGVLFFALSLITLAGLHAAALTFYLYWIYLWFDMPMHVLGGATVALGYQSKFLLGRFSSSLSFTPVGTLLFVFVIGVSWELYEFTLSPALKDFYYFRDTLSDLSMDIIGGTIGYIVARALQKL